MTRLWAFIIAGLALAVSLRAEDAPPVPKAPFLARLPADTAWTVAIEAKAAPAAEAKGAPLPTRKQVAVTRHGGLRREVTLWSNGNKTELWITHEFVFDGTPGGSYKALLVGIAAYPDFPDYAWVGNGYFKTVDTKDGQRCFMFYWPHRAVPGAESANVPLEPTAVWISIDTQLPVAFETEHERGTYHFDVASEPLALPEACQKILETVMADRKRISGQRMAPLPPPRDQ